MDYQINEVYTMKVLGLSIDRKTDKHYLQIQDEEGKQYRVKPFRYHIDWAGDIDTVNCVCSRIDPITNKPWFKLRKLELLEKFYQVGEEYPFVVREKCVDENTGAQYYEIEDNILEISQRYYTKEEHSIGDIFTLNVSAIEENAYKDAFLKFGPKNEPSNAVVESKSDENEVIEGLSEARAKVGGAEGQCVEWKSSIAFVAGQITPDIDRQLGVILKIIASFQNSKGGTLFIGVNDNGLVSGIHQDFQYLNTGSDEYQYNKYQYNTTLDAYQLKIHNAVKERLGALSNSHIDINFVQEGELYYCVVKVDPTRRPVFLDQNALFQRAGNMCQRLRGEDLTNFILDRERQYSLYNVPITEVPPVKYVEKEQEVQPLSVQSIPEQASSMQIKYYMQFYNNGQWSYSKSPSGAHDIKIEVPIYKETLKEALLLCYNNGGVNRICPYDFLNPKRANGRRGWKDEGRRYGNGMYAEAELMNVYTCMNKDYIAVLSTDKTFEQFAKVHSISAIAEHTTIHLKGNQLVPSDATTVSFVLVPVSKYHFVSALSLRDYQTTTSYGFRRKNIQLRGTFENLDKLAR